MKRVLVIGGSGFIGTWLIRELVRAGHDVISMDPEPAMREFIGDDFREIPFALQEFVASCELPDVDVVVPLQGQLGSVDSVRRPLISLHDSVFTNRALLQTLRLQGKTPLVVFVSSDLCYSPEPRCFYAADKLATEHALGIYRAIADIPYVILRTATCYGPWQKRDSVVNFYVKRALKGDTIPVYGDGMNLRAFIYIEDTATAIRMACEGVFCLDRIHPVVGHNSAILEIAEAVYEIVYGGRVEHGDWPELAAAVDVGNLPIFKLGPEGWLPKVGLREGIEKTADWMRGKTR